MATVDTIPILLKGGLVLPPKDAQPTAANVKALQAGLTSVIAGHPQAKYPWTFYEVLDRYLGPWGPNGYPIAYGKFYCVAFNANEKLLSNPVTHQWIAITTVKLQESLRDYVVARFKAGTLARISEPELRQAAFATHARAYTDGGLAMVILVAPELIDVIATVPGKEFSPWSANFKSTVMQVLSTLDQVAPRAVGIGLATLAGPAHTGLFARAAEMDMRDMLTEQSTALSLKRLLTQIRSGALDSIPALQAITDRINSTEYPDRGLAIQARQVIEAADERKHYVAKKYRSLVQIRPDLRSKLDTTSPGWNQW